MRGRCELDGQRLGKVAREIGLDGASASTPFLCFSKGFEKNSLQILCFQSSFNDTDWNSLVI